jgi:hypothetical protein
MDWSEASGLMQGGQRSRVAGVAGERASELCGVMLSRSMPGQVVGGPVGSGSCHVRGLSMPCAWRRCHACRSTKTRTAVGGAASSG